MADALAADIFASMIAGIERQGIPRPEIVRLTGLSKNTVWRLASGEARYPNYDTIQRITALERSIGATTSQVRPLEPKRR